MASFPARNGPEEERDTRAWRPAKPTRETDRSGLRFARNHGPAAHWLTNAREKGLTRAIDRGYGRRSIRQTYLSSRVERSSTNPRASTGGRSGDGLVTSGGEARAWH